MIHNPGGSGSVCRTWSWAAVVVYTVGAQGVVVDWQI
jgi:hypothetical protein